MRFKKLPFVRRADEGDCSAKITDVSPGQIMTIAKGTGLPEDLLRACRFKHNPNRPCVYDAWGIAGGFYPNRTKYEPILSIAKIIAIVIPVLKEHVDEGLITYDEINVMEDQTTPNFKSVASLYSKQLRLLAPHSEYILQHLVLNLPKELMDTMNWPNYNHDGKLAHPGDSGYAIGQPPPEENEEPEEEESIYDILKKQSNQKLWANFQDFLDWMHMHYKTEKKYETKARKAIFYVQAFDNRLKITPESSGVPIFLSKNELRKHFNIAVAEFSHHFEDKTLFEPATYEYKKDSGGMIASYWPVILGDYVRWYCSHGKPSTSQIGAMNLPTANEIMKPLLEFLRDGLQHTVRGEIEDHLAKHFGLSEEQVKHEKASGGEPLFLHTIRWAVTPLLQTKLISRPAEGIIQITARGLEVLKENPDMINEAYLMKFPEYREKRGKDKQPKVRLLGEKYHQKLEINGNIVTAKNLVPPIMRQFLSDGEWHTKKELDIWLRDEYFRVTEEDLKNAMYFKKDADNRKPRTVLYVKAVGAISMIRKAKWLLDRTFGEWKLNSFGLEVSRLNESAIMAKLDELHIPEDIEDGEEMSELKEFDNDTIPVLTQADINAGIEKIKEKLWIETSTINEIIWNLLGGKPILLVGPVGTGKTELARMIPEIFWEKHGGYFSEVYTATADWTTHDVIGGIVPKMIDDKVGYKIENGCITSTVKENWNEEQSRRNYSIKKSYIGGSEKPFRGVWLVIDEFNRADIDKAFGQIFTSVDSKILKIPTNQEKDFDSISIPNDFRIIGTLNSADKHTLFKLSDALKRRFAIIQVDIPPENQQTEEIKYAMDNALSEIKNIIPAREKSALVQSPKSLTLPYEILAFVRFTKPLGTAVLKSIFQTWLIAAKYGQLLSGLDIALTNNLSPQLESLEKETLHILREIVVENGTPIDTLRKIEENKILRAEYAKSFEFFEKFINICLVEERISELEIKQSIEQFKQGTYFKNDQFVAKLTQAYDDTNKAKMHMPKFVNSIDNITKNLI